MTSQKKRVPPPPPGSRDRRQHERFDVLAQVELRGTGEVDIFVAQNISLGGILLEVPEGEAPHLRPGVTVQLFLSLGDVELATSAEVVRVQEGPKGTPRSVGFQWKSEDPSDVACLAQILALARKQS